MTRREELKKIFENVEEDKQILIRKDIDYCVDLEEELDTLIRLHRQGIAPFTLVNKRTHESKTTGNGKRYKEIQQSYQNCLKVLNSVLRNASVEEEDAFEQWMKKRE